jgi:hypothetical protein
MPRIGETIKRLREGQVEVVLTAKLAREQFDAAFSRSRKGNLYRHWEDKTISVFRRGDGRYLWSIAGASGVRYSSCSYEEEEDALGALWRQTEGQEW